MKSKLTYSILQTGALLLIIFFVLANCKKVIENQNFYIVSKISNPGYAQSVYVTKLNNKPYAFVASGQAGLVIYDVDNIEQPQVKAQWMDSINTCWSVTTKNNYAYLAYGSKLYVKLNIANIDSIRVAACFTSLGFVAYAYDIFATDTNYISIAGRERFMIYDLTDPIFPDYRTLWFPRCVRGVFVVDSLAYLACEQLGLVIVNTKFAPQMSCNLVSSKDTPSNARGVFVKDNTAYVADGRFGLVIIDVSIPISTVICGKIDLPGYAHRVFVKDTLAYLACGDAGLCIVNIKQKDKPFLVETVNTSYAQGVFVNDQDIIFVADRDEGLIIIKQKTHY